MDQLIDTRDERADADPSRSGTLTAELASCLERFLEGTADEGTMSRSRRAMDAWQHLLRPGLSPAGTAAG